MTPRGKQQVVWLSIACALVFVGLGFALKDRIAAEWWASKLSSDDDIVWREACSRLAELRPRRAIVPLARALQEDRGTNWVYASRALCKIGPERVLETLESLDPPEDEFVHEVFELLLGTLGQEPQLRTDSTMSGLRACLRARSNVIRVMCASWVECTPEDLDLVIPAILDGIRSGTPSWKSKCIESLGEFKEAALHHIPLLVGFLSDANDELRQSARSALADLGFEAAPAVLELLRGPDGKLRREAAQILNVMGDRYWLENVKPVNPDGTTGPIGVPPAMETAIRALVETLNDADPQVRAAAAEALYFWASSEEVLDVIVHVLEDSDRSVRQAALEELGALGSRAAKTLSALEAALSDHDEEVRKAAVEAQRK